MGCFGSKRFLSDIYSDCYHIPYQRKSMGIVWKRLGHIWPICGNGMGRLGDDMKLIWAIILPNFKLWKIHGKKSRGHLSYGKATGKQYP